MSRNANVSAELIGRHARCRMGYLHSVIMSNFSSGLHYDADMAVAVIVASVFSPLCVVNLSRH